MAAECYCAGIGAEHLLNQYDVGMSIMVVQGVAGLRLRDMFLRYTNVMRRAGVSGWDDALAVEVFHRLDRLEWLEWEVRSRELEARNPRIANERQAQLMVELPTLTEAWYYLAFRVMRLIKRNCPELESFEVKAISVTRNMLIEHDNGIYSANISLGGEGGPQVKGPRCDGQSQKWPDPGMFASAAEFDSQLRKLLDPYVLRDVKEANGSA